VTSLSRLIIKLKESARNAKKMTYDDGSPKFSDLTDKEWREIRAIGRDLFLNNAHDCDQFKIAVEATLTWLVMQEDDYEPKKKEKPLIYH